MSADLATQLSTEVVPEAAPLFVINLCASTSPMALSHPNTPELKRYTFFVSRQREEGRERFRLHMGYFASQEQAESLLGAVRDVYPAAWAGPAPTTGVPRRTRMSVAPKVTVSPPVAPAVSVQAPAVPMPLPEVAPPAPPPTLDSMSNVRDVIAQLGEESPQVRAPAPASLPNAPAMKQAQAGSVIPVLAAAAPSELNASQALRVLESATTAPAAAPAPAVTPKVSPPAAVRPAANPARGTETARTAARTAPGESAVPVVTPEDTQTLTDIRLDAQNNAPPCFAVQLVWAVTPFDVATLPHLAIFDAYTLYNVEGSRQGRKWFGLRLGFFSDPNSATQVAHYVRSDYPAVAVVPVATRERDHAQGGSAPAPRPSPAPAPLRPEASLPIEKEDLNGFELLPDDAPLAAKRDVEDAAAQPPAAAPVSSEPSMTARQKIAAAAAPKPAGKRVVVRKRPQQAPVHRGAPGAPNPLESTLDILGASTLTLDESREIVNDSVIRKPIQKKSGSRFSKLINRLSGG